MGCTVSLNSNESSSGDKLKGNTKQQSATASNISSIKSASGIFPVFIEPGVDGTSTNKPGTDTIPTNDQAVIATSSKDATVETTATSAAKSEQDTSPTCNSIDDTAALEPIVDTDAKSTMAKQPSDNTARESSSSSTAPVELLLPELTRCKRGYLKPRETINDNAPDGFLTVHEMYNMVNSGYGMPYILDPRYILILDARDQFEYMQNHLLTARHHTAIDSDYDCILEAGKLDQYNFIVLYDESSTSNQTSETLTALCERIKERHTPYILDGGIKEFQKAYPFLCTDQIIVTEKERYQEIQSYPSNVLYGVLFQGNGKQATSKKVIEDLGITHIVNITVEYENEFRDSVDYHHLKFTDEIASRLEHRLPGAADFIADAIRHGGRVLVHCVQGISRSSTITLSFLMKYQAWTLQDAYHFLKDKRPAAQPNRGFFSQLGNFERDLFGERISDVDQLWIG